jgi:hypothetical protein
LPLKVRDMPEEQSGFKVTDRRLFNADGSPRDIEPGAEPAKTAISATPEPATEPPQTVATPETSSAATPDRSDSQATQSPDTDQDLDADPAGEVGEEAELPGASDPASFINFLMSLATNAAAALGMMPHPGTGESRVDLQLAKHWIDVLRMLRERTHGNLDPREDQVFEGILADLQMQYVSLTSGPAQSKFTGRDIIGGK